MKRSTVDFTESVKSFMWHRNSKGLRTVPWGTPELTETSSDTVPSRTTHFSLGQEVCEPSMHSAPDSIVVQFM